MINLKKNAVVIDFECDENWQFFQGLKDDDTWVLQKKYAMVLKKRNLVT